MRLASGIPRSPFYGEMFGGLRTRAAATLSTAVGAVALAGGESLADTVEARLRDTDRHAGVAVLYHVIGERPGDPRRELMAPVGKDAFAAQLAYLDGRFRVVRASELPEAAATRKPGERFPVAITFDDNARSNVELAAPALRERDLPATFYLLASEPDAWWWETLQIA